MLNSSNINKRNGDLHISADDTKEQLTVYKCVDNNDGDLEKNNLVSEVDIIPNKFSILSKEEDDDEIDTESDSEVTISKEFEASESTVLTTDDSTFEQTTPLDSPINNIPNDLSIFNTLKQPAVMSFMMIVFLSGLGAGVIDGFLFLRLKQLGGNGLVMGVARALTCASELPCFHYAGMYYIILELYYYSLNNQLFIYIYIIYTIIYKYELCDQ